MTDWIEESVGYSDIGVGSDVIPLDSETGLPDNHVLTIRERRITVDENILIQNNVKTDTITLDLDAEWDDVAEIIVIFTDMRLQSIEKIYEAPAVAIPASAQDEVGTLEVSVVGYNADHTMRLVTVYAPAMFEVIRSGKITGSITTDEADDMLAQLASAAEAATTAAATANAAASSVNEAVEDAETAATAANAASETATQAAQQVADAMEGLEDATNAAEAASANATSAALSAQAAAQAAQQAAESATDNVLRGYVSETNVASADEAWDRSPLELKVYGNTRQNLWSNDWTTYTSNGMVIEENPDGTIHVDASQTTGSPAGRYAKSYTLKPGASYIACADKPLGNTSANSFLLQFYNSSGTRLQSIAFGYTDNGLDVLNATFVVPDEASYTLMTVYPHDVAAGINDGDYRVMLYEVEPSKNLWVNPTGTSNGVTVTSNADGSTTVNGTATSTVNLSTSDIYTLKPGSNYALTLDAQSNGVSFSVRDYSGGSYKKVLGAVNSGEEAAMFSVPDGVSAVRFFVSVTSGATASGTYKIMLNEGSTALPWVPPAGYPLEPWCPPGIHSVGELMPHERNLWDIDGNTYYGVTVAKNADSSYTLSGESGFDGNLWVNKDPIDSDYLVPGKAYTLTCRSDDWAEGVSMIVRFAKGGTYVSAASATKDTPSVGFTAPQDFDSFIMTFAVSGLGTEASGTYRVMLNEGSTASPWVPPGCESAVQVVTTGKNLLDFEGPIESNIYNIANIPLAQCGYTDGDVYTATLWGELGDGKSNFCLYNTGGKVQLCILDKVEDGVYRKTFFWKSGHPTSPYKDNSYVAVFVLPGSVTGVNSRIDRIQLEKSSIATDYEPPSIVTTPIDLQGNELCSLPDGTRDELDVMGGDVESNYETIVLDGTESWTSGDYPYLYYAFTIQTPVKRSSAPLVCDSLPSGSTTQNGVYVANGGAVLYVREPTFCTDLESFKSWLSANPVTIVYEIASQTVPITPPSLPALPPTWSMWVQPNANGVPATLSVEYERNVTTAIQNLEALLNGSVIFIGEGVPTDAVKAREGDRYLDETTGKIYELVEVEE